MIWNSNVLMINPGEQRLHFEKKYILDICIVVTVTNVPIATYTFKWSDVIFR